MKAVIGTAGHIDHGKSALVRALTGIETDRLPEERARGISIELGFAYLDLGGGERAGIVDVPGHERFIRQMLAGAQGFDLVVLVVAADDGVMPQTEEHFEIVHLLGVRRVIFAITKIDMVTPERIDEVRDEVEILAAGTPSENAPVVAVSAIRGDGVDELRGLITESLADLDHVEDHRPLRLPIDRVFVMKGHGTVITGTALAGSVAVGDEVEILPRGAKVRVRDVQVHGAAVERAWAGQRVALNLGGVAKDGVARGDTVAGPQGDLRSDRFDARVEVRPLAARPLRSHERVRVYLATQEALGRIIWLDGVEEVAPRGTAYAQIVLNEPAVVAPRDRFVLRDETASRTLGGGMVLVAHARRHRRAAGPVSERLSALESGDDGERMRAFLGLTPQLGLAPSDLAEGGGVEVSAIPGLIADGETVLGMPDNLSPSIVMLRSRYDAYADALVEQVSAFHRERREQAGMDIEHLRVAVQPEVDSRLFRRLLEAVESAGRLRRRGAAVSIPGHEVSVRDEDEGPAKRLSAAIHQAGAMPPTLKQLEDDLGIDARRLATLLGVLVERGEVVKVSSDLFFSAAVLGSIEQRLRGFLEREGEITASAFRDLITASRKYCIPLLDHFDRSGVTLRIGDVRRLRA